MVFLFCKNRKETKNEGAKEARIRENGIKVISNGFSSIFRSSKHTHTPKQTGSARISAKKLPDTNNTEKNYNN